MKNQFEALARTEEEEDETEDQDSDQERHETTGEGGRKTTEEGRKKKMPRMPKRPSKQAERKQEKKDRSRKKDQIAATEEEIDKILNYLEDEPEEADETMLSFGEQHGSSQGWVKLSGVVDSGASDHVANKAAAPHVPIKPSVGSIKGQNFIAANGDRVPNEGEQELHVVTEEGATSNMVVQVTDVKKPLFSVTKLCDRGNRVIFGRGGGVIHNLATNRLTPFRRKGGVYMIDLWVQPPGEDPGANCGWREPGFQRQG